MMSCSKEMLVSTAFATAHTQRGIGETHEEQGEGHLMHV